MTTPWQTPPSTPKSHYSIQADEAVLDQIGVFLIYGTNTFGDKTYSYLETTVRRLQDMQAARNRGEQFLPSQFGTVIAAGRGEPSPEIKDEMRVKYNLVDAAPPTVQKQASKPIYAPPPRFDYDLDSDD